MITWKSSLRLNNISLYFNAVAPNLRNGFSFEKYLLNLFLFSL